MSQLILASSSPRRQTYFSEMGLDFDVFSPNIDETPQKGEKPKDYVERVAKEKALEVYKYNKGSVIVAADTTVSLGQRILGKPETKEEASFMLRLMSGRRQRVLTSVCVVSPEGKIMTEITSTVVKLKQLTQEDIDRHISKAENWQGKAGGYGIQTTSGGLLVKGIIGSYTGVVGLPLIETTKLLRRCGIVF